MSLLWRRINRFLPNLLKRLLEHFLRLLLEHININFNRWILWPLAPPSILHHQYRYLLATLILRQSSYRLIFTLIRTHGCRFLINLLLTLYFLAMRRVQPLKSRFLISWISPTSILRWRSILEPIKLLATLHDILCLIDRIVNLPHSYVVLGV